MENRFKFRAWCKHTVNNKLNFAYIESEKINQKLIKEDKYDFNRRQSVNHKLYEHYLRIWDKNNSKEKEITVENIMVYDRVGSLFDTIRYGYEVLCFMQSTGLRDKNGKLIFEGDVLETIFSDGSKTIHTIEYNQDTASFNANSKKYEISCKIEKDWVSEKKIIGNIYINKELIGE